MSCGYRDKVANRKHFLTYVEKEGKMEEDQPL
jgi:hypothetical protein